MYSAQFGSALGLRREVLTDEPTGNLDADTAEQVLLGRSLRLRGKTLVMATHSREDAAIAK